MADHGDHSSAGNLEEQARLYGAPLVTIFDDVTSALGISRRRLSQTLGLSAPMLSQLASGHRLKIGNPRALQRLQSLVQALPEVRSGVLDPEKLLADIAVEAGQVLTGPTTRVSRQGAADVHHVLRAAASADELTRAADLLQPEFPGVAEVLRVYGTGDLGEAVEHFRRIAPPAS